jgi:O-antigen ligase
VTVRDLSGWEGRFNPAGSPPLKVEGIEGPGIDVARVKVSYVALRRMAQHLDPVIFISLLALLPLVAIPYGSVHRVWEALFECVVFALGALWIVEGLFSGEWRVSGHRLLLPLIALIALALVQTIPLGLAIGSEVETWRALSADPYETRRFALKLLALTLAGLLLLRYTSNQRRFRTLIHVVIGVGVASALFGIIRQVGQGNLPNFVLPQLDPGRSYAQFIDRNHFAFLIEMVLGLVLGLMVGRGLRFDRRLIYLTASLFLCSSLVLSNSRGGIFAMVCQLLFIAVLFRAARASHASGKSGTIVRGWLRRMGSVFIVRAGIIVCLLITVTAGVVWVGGDQLMHRLGTVSREFRANSDDKRMSTRRVEIWETTWRLIKAHPITGIGFGGFGIAFPRHDHGSGTFTSDEAQLRPLAAHNEYLELLASGGLIGGALGIWFVIALIKGARGPLQRSRDPFRRAACFGALAGLFGVGIHSLVDFGLHDTVNAFVFTSLVVIATLNGGEGGAIATV